MAEKKIATFVGRVNEDTARGEQRLYRVEPPHMTYDGKFYGYVTVSAVDGSLYSGPETYIFPAHSDGMVADWMEMEGSIQGCLDHDAALREAGYTVIYPETKEA